MIQFIPHREYRVFAVAIASLNAVSGNNCCLSW